MYLAAIIFLTENLNYIFPEPGNDDDSLVITTDNEALIIAGQSINNLEIITAFIYNMFLI